MKLYHGTGKSRLDSIMSLGLKPAPNWDSGSLPVVSLTNSISQALQEAFVVDMTKIQLGEKKKPERYYVVLEVDVKKYKVKKWQIAEWWIRRTVSPHHLKVVSIQPYKNAKKACLERFESYKDKAGGL